MTYDSSRLVDTACIGYSHLQPAGLSVLRQRYRPAVLQNLRVRRQGWRLHAHNFVTLRSPYMSAWA